MAHFSMRNLSLPRWYFCSESERALDVKAMGHSIPLSCSWYKATLRPSSLMSVTSLKSLE